MAGGKLLSAFGTLVLGLLIAESGRLKSPDLTAGRFSGVIEYMGVDGVPTSSLRPGPKSKVTKGVAVFFGKSSLVDLFVVVDRRDAQAFERFLHDQVHFRFGNASPVSGKRAVDDGVRKFFDSVAGLRHVVIRSWEHEDTVICSGEVTYTRMDGTELLVPFANILTVDSGLIVEYSIYADISELYRGR